MPHDGSRTDFLSQTPPLTARILLVSLCTFSLSGCAIAVSPNHIAFPNQSSAVTIQGARIIPGPLQFPSGFMTSVKSYGATGDGVTDDTVAIQQALADGRSDTSLDYFGRPKALYFPPGTYLVHDTLSWTGCCVLLQGAGSSASVIRLMPASPGFADPANPKALVFTPAGNESFRQNIWDIGFAVGTENPRTTALNYISNNDGSMHNVVITSEDGKGHAGIDLTREWSGPLLIRDTKIDGFDMAMDLKNAEYSVTIEGLTIAAQNVVGIHNVDQPINIRNFISSNAVPALTNSGGIVVLLDGSLIGGLPSNAAIQTNNAMYLRNVSSSGYGATLTSVEPASATTVTGSIPEYSVGNPVTLTPGSTGLSLNLPVAETPPSPVDDLSQWAAFVPRYNGDLAGLQALLDSGNSTIYFPFGSYGAYTQAQVTVPDTVHRIVGFSSVFNSSTGIGSLASGGIRFIVDSDSTEPLVVEEFGYGVTVDHRGSRPVAMKEGLYDYTSTSSAGDIYLEDIQTNALTVQPRQHMWARQLDDEIAATKIVNNGTLWVLGMKTEQFGTVIDTTADGQTELLGALIYPATTVGPTASPAFQSNDAKTSYIYTESVYCAQCGYATQIRETNSGTTREVSTSPGSSFRMPLFVGYQ